MPKYKFYAGYPSCNDRTPGLWRHKDCSSYEEIDEDGWIYCFGCSKYLGFIMDLRYNCGNHIIKMLKIQLQYFKLLYDDRCPKEYTI